MDDEYISITEPLTLNQLELILKTERSPFEIFYDLQDLWSLHLAWHQLDILTLNFCGRQRHTISFFAVSVTSALGFVGQFRVKNPPFSKNIFLRN